MLPDFLKTMISRRLGEPKPIAPHAKRLKACILKLDRIGDFIMALGAIRFCTNFYGEANCALVVHKLVADLARREFPQAVIIELSRSTGAGLRDCLSLRNHEANEFTHYEFETLICLRHQRYLLHNIVLSWIHAERSFGIVNSTIGISSQDRTILPFAFTNVLPDAIKPRASVCLELERHNAVLEAVFKTKIPVENILPRFLSIQPVAGDDLIVTPFSSGSGKDYPASAMIEALKIIVETANTPVVLCGGPSDQERLQALGVDCRKNGIFSRIQISHSVFDFAKTISTARAVLTVDTASAHIATSLDKATVIILGGAHFEHFGPWQRSNRQIWITNHLPCFGCDWKCPFETPRCITEIPSAQVAEAMLKLLD